MDIPAFNTILARRSIRRYQEDRPVEREKIIQLLEAARAAPSACNIVVFVKSLN